MLSGIVMVVGIGLHNFPEGIAVFLPQLRDYMFISALELAIALHNNPEGVAAVLSIYFATEN
jgi:ZIP family zinc transporter